MVHDGCINFKHQCTFQNGVDYGGKIHRKNIERMIDVLIKERKNKKENK